MAIYFGFNPPFVGGNQGVLSRQEDERLIKNDILQLLLTLPGERVHEPFFGTRIRAAVFEPLDDVTMSELEEEIRAAIANEEPRLTDPNVYMQKDEQRNTLRITVSGRLTLDPNTILKAEAEVPLPGAT